jgi:hypothetical protein
MDTVGTGRVKSAGRPRNALLIALAVALGVSLLMWSTVALWLATPRHKLLLLGDSYSIGWFVGPGGRLEDWLQRDLGEPWVVENFGQSNAHMGDHYLELAKAEFLGFRPDAVVLGLSPHKLVPDDEQQEKPRFRNHGRNLRWLPWNAEGLQLFGSLTRDEQVASVVQKIGLIFGFYDGLDGWFEEHVTARKRVARFRHTDADRTHSEVHRTARKIAAYWERKTIGTYEQVRGNTETRDLAFLVHAIRRRHIQVVAALLPVGNEALLQNLFSPAAREKLAISYQYTLRVCQELQLPVIDFNTPERRAQFGAEQWGDTFHLKTAAAYGELATPVATWIRQHVPAG